MWNDLDIYLARRDITNDPVSFPIDEMKAMIDDLVRALFLFFITIGGLDKNSKAHSLFFWLVDGSQSTLHSYRRCGYRSSS